MIFFIIYINVIFSNQRFSAEITLDYKILYITVGMIVKSLMTVKA